MGMYMFFLANSNFFAPLISGFISDGMGWQWVLVCLTNISLILVLVRNL
jgi:hypothetical protein